MSSFDGNPQQEVTLLAAIAQRLGADPRYVMGQEEVGLLRLILAGIGNIVEGGGGGASGDMLKSTYDPASIGEQVVGLTATQQISNKQITGGTIDATPIGGDTPDTGAFTTLESASWQINGYSGNGILSWIDSNTLRYQGNGLYVQMGRDYVRGKSFLNADELILGYASDASAGGGDLVLLREAANALALRNGTNAQTFNLYNTYTDGSNYERATLSWSSIANYLVFGTENAGTGSARDLVLRSAGTLHLQTSGNNTRWYIPSQGHLLAQVDNTYDIGASGANRPRNLYVADQIHWGGGTLTGLDVAIGTSGVVRWASRGRVSSSADGVILLQNNAANDFSHLQFGGTSSSFPSMKRSGANIEFRHADDTNTGGTGIILSSPNGTRYRISVDNAGAFTSAAA